MTKTSQAYADYLQEFSWDFFATVTCRQDRRDPLALKRDVWQAFRPHCSRGFIAIEPHKTGMLHAHGIFRSKLADMPSHSWYSARGTVPEQTPLMLWSTAFHRFGRSKVELINGHADVTNYCSKYVVKTNYEYDFLGNWPLPGGVGQQ